MIELTLTLLGCTTLLLGVTVIYLQRQINMVRKIAEGNLNLIRMLQDHIVELDDGR